MSEVTATSVDISIVLKDNNGRSFRLNFAAPIQSMTSLTLQELVEEAAPAEEAISVEAPAVASAEASTNNNREVVELLDDSSIGGEEVVEDLSEYETSEAEESEAENSSGADEPSSGADEPPVIAERKRHAAARTMATSAANTNRSRTTRAASRSNRATIVLSSDESDSSAEEAYGLSQEFF